jgi:hypothetical protein
MKRNKLLSRRSKKLVPIHSTLAYIILQNNCVQGDLNHMVECGPKSLVQVDQDQAAHTRLVARAR